MLSYRVAGLVVWDQAARAVQPKNAYDQPSNTHVEPPKSSVQSVEQLLLVLDPELFHVSPVVLRRVARLTRLGGFSLARCHLACRQAPRDEPTLLGAAELHRPCCGDNKAGSQGIGRLRRACALTLRLMAAVRDVITTCAASQCQVDGGQQPPVHTLPLPHARLCSLAHETWLVHARTTLGFTTPTRGGW